jgi:hypothetical protein
VNLIHFCLKRFVGTYMRVLRTRFVHWTTPLTSSLPLGTLTDLARSKAELMAENALLRQQLIMLKRQVKRPACTKTDRILLVLRARAVRTWKQTLFLVQPDTLLRWHRELFRLYWKRRSKASSHPRDAQRDSAPHQRRKVSISNDIRVVGGPCAHPTDPCQLAGIPKGKGECSMLGSKAT